MFDIASRRRRSPHARLHDAAFCTSPVPVIPERLHKPLVGATCVSNGLRYFTSRRSGTTRWHVMTAAMPNSYAATENSMSSGISDEDLVSSLLHLVRDNDGGPQTSSEKREAIDMIVQELSKRGERQKPLSSPRLFDNYNVAYVSSRQRSQPAGGLFRGTLGRLLLPGRGIFQHIREPNVVVNQVAFRLFGVFPGAVALKGIFCPLPDSDIGPNAVRVDFDSPRVMFLGMVFTYGPKDFVKLRTTYLDGRIRIGIGSRGSLFVFTRDGLAKEAVAEEWKTMFSDTRRSAPAILLPLMLISIVGLAVRLIQRCMRI